MAKKVNGIFSSNIVSATRILSKYCSFKCITKLEEDDLMNFPEFVNINKCILKRSMSPFSNL